MVARSVMQSLNRALFGGLQEQYRRLLTRELAGCRSVLDLGCGQNSPVSRIQRGPACHLTVGVDIHEEGLRAARRSGTHDQFVVTDLTMLGGTFKSKSFDCVLALDLLEHLEKPLGSHLLQDMERVARTLVLVFTPNGFLEQPPAEDNPWQEHLSGWTVGEFRERGYRVLGVHGWRPLRTQYAQIAFHPTRLWQRISLLTQPVTQRYPGLAFQLLAVKHLS